MATPVLINMASSFPAMLEALYEIGAITGNPGAQSFNPAFEKKLEEAIDDLAAGDPAKAKTVKDAVKKFMDDTNVLNSNVSGAAVYFP